PRWPRPGRRARRRPRARTSAWKPRNRPCRCPSRPSGSSRSPRPPAPRSRTPSPRRPSTSRRRIGTRTPSSKTKRARTPRSAAASARASGW
ncbi:PAT1 multi-domain protein, partial [bacterium]